LKNILFILLITTSIFANIGKITAIKGDVLIERNSQIFSAKLGMFVEQNDTVKTKTNARTQLVFTDNTIISIGKNSVFSIQEYLFESKKPVVAKFKFGNGIFKTITGKIGKINPKKFILKTKTASIGIRGTIVGIDSSEKGDIIIIPQGIVEVITPEGVVVVNEGEMIESIAGVKPEVKAIPEARQNQLEEDSGSKSNEEESGQGEATQTTALTQKEKEEAKEQNKAEEETSQEKEETSTKKSTQETKSEEKQPNTVTNIEKEEVQIKNPLEDTKTNVVDDVSIVVDAVTKTVNDARDSTTITVASTSSYASSLSGYNLDKVLAGSSEVSANNVSLSTGELLSTSELYSSYYENSDLFGILATSDDIDSLITDSGYLISVLADPNGETYQTSDDESSWGYWTSSYAGTNSSYDVDDRLTWVAGIETSESIVQGVIDGTSQTSGFSGYVLGAVTNGSNVYPILFDGNNNVSLSFEFGGGSAALTGSIAFHTSNSQQWNATIDGTGTSTTFTGTASNNTSGSNIVITSGSLDGKYFGTGSIKSVGGKFNLSDGTNDAAGVFKANSTGRGQME